MTSTGLLYLFAGSFIGWVAGLLCGIHIGYKRMRRCAIAGNVGKWKVDPETGKAYFVFLNRERETVDEEQKG